MTVWFGGQQLGQSDHLLEAAVELAVTERHRTCDQIKRALWLPGIPRGLSGRRQPGCEASPLTGELGGAFVGGRGGGMTGAQLRAAGGRLECHGHLLITGHGRHGLMPDPMVDVFVARERYREGDVDALALTERGSLVDGGAHERMAELDRGAVGADQRGLLGGTKRVAVEPELAERAQDNGQLPGPVDRDHKQRLLRTGGQPVDPPTKEIGQTRGERHRLGQRRASRQLVLAQRHGQLDQRQWVAARLGQEPGPDRGHRARRVLHPRRSEK